MAINNLKRKRENSRPRKAENLRQRKETLLKKVYKLGKDYEVDVALILRQNSRYFTYRLLELQLRGPATDPTAALRILRILRIHRSFS
jgi:hypothetical protein